MNQANAPKSKSNKNTRKIILCILIFIFAVIYALQLIFTGKSKIQTLTVKEDADQLTITSLDKGKINLVKENDSWYVGEKKYKADSDTVQRLLDSLTKMKIVGSVSSSAEGDEDRYGLNESRAIQVELFSDGELLRQVKIGKDTVTGGQCYIQLDGKNQVYILGEGLDGLFTKDIAALRDTMVYDFSESGISQITFEKDGQSVTFEKDFVASSSDDESENSSTGTVWNLISSSSPVDEEKIDSDKVSTWANGLSFLRVASWLDDSYALSQEALPFAKVKITATDGSKTELAAYQTKTEEVTVDQDGNESTSPAEYVFKSSSQPYYFTLSSNAQTKIARNFSDFAKD